jgi:hypothetical protein
MYLTKIITMLLVSLLSFSTQAFESSVKPLVMVYLTVPLDGTRVNEDAFNYGFRLDHVAYTPGEPVNYQQQFQRTASLDFRMDKQGLDGIYISGKDYLHSLRVNRQNEDQGSDETTAEATDDAATDIEDEDDGLTVSDRIKGVIADMRAVAPMGIYMGVGLGIVLLLGVDD